MLSGPQQSVGVIILISAVAAAMMFFGLWTMYRKHRRGEKIATGEVVMIIILLAGIVALAVSNVLKHGR